MEVVIISMEVNFTSMEEIFTSMQVIFTSMQVPPNVVRLDRLEVKCTSRLLP